MSKLHITVTYTLSAFLFKRNLYHCSIYEMHRNIWVISKEVVFLSPHGNCRSWRHYVLSSPPVRPSHSCECLISEWTFLHKLIRFRRWKFKFTTTSQNTFLARRQEFTLVVDQCRLFSGRCWYLRPVSCCPYLNLMKFNNFIIDTKLLNLNEN